MDLPEQPPVAEPAANVVTPAPLVLESAAPLLSPEPPPLKTPESEPFRFHGDAQEYFRIWIVNALLTLLSFGIFASWAKVRRRRYLRGNTEFMGHRFDYTASPRRILLGNIIVVTLFLAYSLFGAVYPWMRFGALGVIALLLPWIVVRSLSFNAYHTVYRGLRFSFNPVYGQAAMIYPGMLLGCIFTLGLLYPRWVRERKHFNISQHRYGTAFFKFNGQVGPFYSVYLLSALIVIVVLVTGGVTSGFFFLHKGRPPTQTQLLPFIALYAGALFTTRQLIHATLFNHVWNHTQLDEHRFIADMKIGRWLGMQFTNFGALLISAGLLYPWTLMRNTRYALSCLHFKPAGSIEHIEFMGDHKGSALGDTAAEFVGFELGL